MILVTGAAGYIGSHSAIDFIKSGYDVVILDNLSVGHIEIIDRIKTFAKSAKGNLVDFIKGDTRDTELLDKLFKTYKIDAVVHFAANSLVNESVTNPSKYYNNNVSGSISLLDAMVKNDVKKIVFSSTCATYGEPEYVPIDEKHPQRPVNPYGNSKLAIEFAIKDYAHAYGLKYMIFRYFNVIGADAETVSGEWHDIETHLVPNILKADSDKVFNLFGTDYDTKDGTCVRDYIDVCDLARAHTMAFEYLQENESTIINLGTGDGQSVKEIFSAVENSLNIKVPLKVCGRREGDPAKLIANNSKAREVLKWQAQTSLEDSVRNAANWENVLKTLQKARAEKQKEGANV
ncbi:MAG: UDP-glucose 4-epimerase GalE [Candidatus Gastranaerophilales bacterium]|nr:UDP-glucose 4-epimerase GalE [Candidatus Gastranaerophilales bacterium]